MIRNLAYAAKTARVVNATAAGTTNITASSVDTFGFEACRFTILMGTLTATQQTIPKVQGSNDNSTWTDLAGTHVGPPADGASNGMLQIDLFRPQYRYLQLIIQRGTANAAIDGAIADLYLAHNEPIPTQDTTMALAPNVQPYVTAGTA